MSAQIASLLLEALGQTLWMVAASGFVGCLFGIPLGVLLYVTRPGAMLEHVWLNRVTGIVVNAGRSIPFIILLVAIIPFTRFLVGTSIGTTAAIVPLALGAIPYIARLIEGALLEIPSGLIEAAQSMGATPLQIIRKVLLPEALPGIINSVTITMVTLVSYSAMAGAIGGGGLGDVGIRYGYQRFNPEIMLLTVVILIALVQLLQMVGDGLVRRYDRRNG